jgi:hypothetical protein
VEASEAGAPDYCDVRCTLDADCTALSRLHRCETGACRAGDAPAATGGSGGTGGGTGEPSGEGGGGEGGGGGCPAGSVGANQVVLLGDSFFAASHQITAFLEGLAREAGVLSAGERYRDNSSLLSSAFADGGILQQYEGAAAEAAVAVVIMNGGGADMLARSCEPLSADCAAIVDATEGARELFAQMAADGVSHVVYAFYPDPIDGALKAKIDLLRPQIETACAESPAPCHFLDLRTVFSGNYGDYVLPDGLNPTEPGSQAAAEAIWGNMQANCVAQ